MVQLLRFYKLYDGEGRLKEREGRENRFIVICCVLRIILFIIMLFIQGRITMAHTLQAVWFLKGTVNIESNQVKQSQHTRKGNVAPPNRQQDAVITFSTSQICCTTTDPTQSLTTCVDNVVADGRIWWQWSGSVCAQMLLLYCWAQRWRLLYN